MAYAIRKVRYPDRGSYAHLPKTNGDQMSIFYDVDAFMNAAGHGPDQKRVNLYLDLVREEIGELEEAMAVRNKRNQLSTLKAHKNQ